MSSRFPSHQLSNGLYVSGRPEQPKERAPTMSSTAVPYTGGDIKRSGELGKMFDIHMDSSKTRKSGQISNAPSRTGNRMGSASSGGVPGSVSSKKSSSGPLNKHGEPVKKSSGPQGGGATTTSRQNSGPLPPVLPTTGLITSGPLNASGAPRKASGPLDSMGSIKLKTTSLAHNQAVTHLSDENGHSLYRSFPKLIFCSAFSWNACWGRRAMSDFIARYPDAELRTARDGQFVKVSGVVTCGNFPLESSFQKTPRCVYTSTSLYEYRGWDSKAANPKHRRFSWGLRSAERHVVDFYVSDFQSGLRALVKAGYGARVIPFVDESVVIDINHSNKDMSPQFVRWLAERNLSSDDRLMRLKEGYIKEGSTVSVMGVVQRNDNILMIVPPPDPVPVGCQWAKCIFPASIEGLALRCEDSCKVDVIPV